MARIGVVLTARLRHDDRSERLDITPAQFRVLVTIRHRYACPKGRAGVVQEKAPTALIEG